MQLEEVLYTLQFRRNSLQFLSRGRNLRIQSLDTRLQFCLVYVPLCQTDLYCSNVEFLGKFQKLGGLRTVFWALVVSRAGFEGGVWACPDGVFWAGCESAICCGDWKVFEVGCVWCEVGWEGGKLICWAGSG